MARSTLWLNVVLLFSLGLLTAAKSHTPYITGGKTAKVGAWPWMASIRSPSSTHVCGGALIKPSIVLTSASCVYRLKVLESSVVLGLHNQADGNIGKPEVVRIKSFIINKNWKNPEGYSDLAIIKLARPASNNTFIKPIALPGKDYDLIAKVCTVTGWGLPGGEEELGTELQQKDLIVWPDVECRRWWQDIDKSRMCASAADGLNPSGVCKLDAGGPLSCPVGGALGYVLGGIAPQWWGGSCSGASPALFANIPSFIDWINENSA